MTCYCSPLKCRKLREANTQGEVGGHCWMFCQRRPRQCEDSEMLRTRKSGSEVLDDSENQFAMLSPRAYKWIVVVDTTVQRVPDQKRRLRMQPLKAPLARVHNLFPILKERFNYIINYLHSKNGIISIQEIIAYAVRIWCIWLNPQRNKK